MESGLTQSKNAVNVIYKNVFIVTIGILIYAFMGFQIMYPGDFNGVFGFGGFGIGFDPSDPVAMLTPAYGMDMTIWTDFIFQAMFAATAATIVSGCVTGRIKLPSFMLFGALLLAFCYPVTGSWVWGGGWLAELGALDFAGGAVVHVNAGAAALVAATVLGTRKDYGRQALLPHHVPFVLLGAGLLWFGWFGFNGGSALASDGAAALAFVNTMLAPAATLVAWSLLDYARTNKVTAVGAGTAIVVGLVAVTPAAGFVSPMSALLIGAIAAVPSYFLIEWRARTRFDDSLDVFAAHGVGGITGALLTGVFADAAWNGTADGLLYGNPAQFGIQALSIVAVFAYSGLLTLGILKALSLVMELRPSTKEEGLGLDVVFHGEEAYTTGEGAVLILDGERQPRPAKAASKEATSVAPA